MTAAAHVWTEEAGPGWLARQRALQRDVLFTWSPVLLILGIWGYFSLPIEPALPVVVIAALLFGALLTAAYFGRGGFSTAAMAITVAGFLLANFQVWRVAAPVLPATTDKMAVAGVVETINMRGRSRATLVLLVTRLEQIDPAVRPQRLRMTLLRPPAGIVPGVEIEGQAYLRPLPVPVIPGGFDYGRQLYLEGVGATGRFTGEISVDHQEGPWRYWLRGRIYTTRQAIGARIAAVLPPEQASFAEALITGERGAIPKHITESLQISGLGHVLSISGLHMSLVAGGVFWLIRALLALSPAVALRRPIKKWAAAGALVAGLGYMLLAGADVATQRSYIMLAVVFVAVIVDRPAISMRNLALAALIVLVIQPSSALSASFHMSFMAVMGLAAFYEAYGVWRAQRDERRQTGPLSRVIRTASLGLFAMAATTLVAGTLSSIPAAYHFGRLTPLSLLTNVLALPVISFVVMPAATVGVLLMPLGLEGLPIWIMGRGLDAVMLISDWVAGLSTSRLTVPLLTEPATVVMTAGMVWLCLWRGPLRFAGILVFAIGAAISPVRQVPDILVEPTAANVAARNSNGDLVPADPRKGRFAVEKWLQAEGDGDTPASAAKRPLWQCEAAMCRAIVAGIPVAWLKEGASADACGDAEIVIASFPLRGACRTARLRIDRFDVWRNGAYALSISGGRFSPTTSRGAQGQRLWTVRPVARGQIAPGQYRGPSTYSSTWRDDQGQRANYGPSYGDDDAGEIRRD